MASTLFTVGAVVAVTLLALLVLTIRVPSVRVWPTPGPGSWQGYLFWPLFRGLNVLCFAVAIADRSPLLALTGNARAFSFALLAVSIGLFVAAFRVLGRGNSYGAQDGLVTRGIYGWSRNPQNAMLIVVYACLAMAADSAFAYVLCAATMAVYALMVLAEEPWLEAAYGDAYHRYCRRVPRFVNWRRAAVLARAIGWRVARNFAAAQAGRGSAISRPGR